MEQRITKLRKIIDEIPNLLMMSSWNSNYEVWKSRTGMLLKREFGDEAYKLFDQQSSPDFMSLDAYGREIISRKNVLESLIDHSDEYHPEPSSSMTNKLVQSGKSGVVFEVGGNMVNNGVIQTAKEAVVGVAVAGDYSSKNSKIIQQDAPLKKWYERPIGILVLTVTGGLIVAGLSIWLGWH